MLPNEDLRSPILTIAIPTYNRVTHLTRLIEFLRRELNELDGEVSIVVADNASTDGTSNMITKLSLDCPYLTIVTHKVNLGMDGNFKFCAEMAKGAFFWIIGDDDLPVSGAIKALLRMLKCEQPDLVLLNSYWSRDIGIQEKNILPITKLLYTRMQRDAFGRRMHVWATYLSGIVVRRTSFLKNTREISSLSGTNLTQLSWVLERLRDGKVFIHVGNTCVLATAGNTGGYPVIEVFGDCFPRIVSKYLSQNSAQRFLAKQIVFRMMLNYLPQLLWGFRCKRLGNFKSENVAHVLMRQVGSHPIMVPILILIGTAPYPIARLMMVITYVFARAIAMVDRIRLLLPLRY